MSERLRHLQRQQALLREHLVWIEAEISRETVRAELSPPRPTAWVPQKNVEAEPIDADALLERYAEKERQHPADIRRGCLLFFIGALALLALTLTAIWWLRYR
jgi:hypothetical protein